MKTHQGSTRFDVPPTGRPKTKTNTFPTHTHGKGGFDGERTRTEARYQKTREARAGMAHCAKVSAVMRTALADYLGCVRDRYHSGRLNGLLVSIKSCDPAVTGPKTFKAGLATDAGRELLLRYGFRKGRMAGANLRRPFAVDPEKGRLTIPDFTPATDHVFPKGTKLGGLQLLLLRVDLDTLAYAFSAGNVVTVSPTDTAPAELVLTCDVPDGEGHLFALLFSGFCEVRGDVLQWGLRMENALGFVGVEGGG